MKYFTVYFFDKVFEIQVVVYTDDTSQLGRVTLQVHCSHLWLVGGHRIRQVTKLDQLGFTPGSQ